MFTHIVAVKMRGNAFPTRFDSPLIITVCLSCWLSACIRPKLFTFAAQAIKELNLKTKNWKELLNDEPFKREHIITIQVLPWI